MMAAPKNSALHYMRYAYMSEFSIDKSIATVIVASLALFVYNSFEFYDTWFVEKFTGQEAPQQGSPSNRKSIMAMAIFVCLLLYCIYIAKQKEWANSLMIALLGAITGRLLQ